MLHGNPGDHQGGPLVDSRNATILKGLSISLLKIWCIKVLFVRLFVRAAARLVFTRQTWLTLDIFDHLLIYLAAKFMLLVWLLAISLFWPSHESGAKPARGARKISMYTSNINFWHAFPATPWSKPWTNVAASHTRRNNIKKLQPLPSGWFGGGKVDQPWRPNSTMEIK